MAASLLSINQRLVTKTEWNEASIVARSEDLFTLALNIWSSPLSPMS
jgi:hypothetical protein